MAEPYNDAKPRVGDEIRYKGERQGRVLRVEGNLCWVAYDDGSEPAPFIWRFRDGLNALHDWPGAAGHKRARCPGVND